MHCCVITAAMLFMGPVPVKLPCTLCLPAWSTTSSVNSWLSFFSLTDPSLSHQPGQLVGKDAFPHFIRWVLPLPTTALQNGSIDLKAKSPFSISGIDHRINPVLIKPFPKALQKHLRELVLFSLEKRRLRGGS